jgi:hypothetical protein
MMDDNMGYQEDIEDVYWKTFIVAETFSYMEFHENRSKITPVMVIT